MRVPFILMTSVIMLHAGHALADERALQQALAKAQMMLKQAAAEKLAADQELAKVKSWTGGGLHAETNPGDNMPPECTLVLKLDGTSWTQAFPEDKPGEYECDPSWVVEISGRVVDNAQLNDDRISTKYLKQ